MIVIAVPLLTTTRLGAAAQLLRIQIYRLVEVAE
jgi:hypothetical protein